jgi:hypothetical protein
MPSSAARRSHSAWQPASARRSWRASSGLPACTLASQPAQSAASSFTQNTTAAAGQSAHFWLMAGESR